MHVIDLRSDTVTQPTASMREAMRRAEVGDDVFGEDPTVNRLEALAAERLGKEAGLFVVSGTMGNLVCQLTHCGRGDEMILGDQAHVFYYEQGGSAAVGGIHPRTVPNQPDGTLSLDDIKAAIRPDDIHFPRTRLILLENTHNRCCGSPLPIEYIRSVRNLTQPYGVKLHLDGARLFNAAAALGVNVRDIAAEVDSVSICLSKGLAAPVGSIICGSADFIASARRMRKVLGGGMRQAGILAAAGIVALSEMTERLDEDHRNARKLADELAALNGIELNPEKVKTNIVYFTVNRNDIDSPALADRLQAEGVRMLAAGPQMMRAVTHYQISVVDIAHTIDIMAKVLG